jgi:tRNA G37 N-methylase Trm5
VGLPYVRTRVCYAVECSFAVPSRSSNLQGGWLHVHANIGEGDGEAWTARLVAALTRLAADAGRAWSVRCVHLEWVKSYAPRVWHVVADVLCEPACA